MELNANEKTVAIAVGVVFVLWLLTRGKSAPGVTDIRRIDNATIPPEPAKPGVSVIRAIDNAALDTPARVVSESNAQGIPQFPAQGVYS